MKQHEANSAFCPGTKIWLAVILVVGWSVFGSWTFFSSNEVLAATWVCTHIFHVKEMGVGRKRERETSEEIIDIAFIEEK